MSCFGNAQSNNSNSSQSDISRLRNLVIHSLYSHKDVFLRELLSNANDALEKLRITSLTDRGVLSSGDANVTLAIDIDPPKADGTGSKTGKITIRDTGIGMAKAELARNLGTIARSGTNEFLKRAEDGSMSEGNLIGQFGELPCPVVQLTDPQASASTRPSSCPPTSVSARCPPPLRPTPTPSSTHSSRPPRATRSRSSPTPGVTRSDAVRRLCSRLARTTRSSSTRIRSAP